MDSIYTLIRMAIAKRGNQKQVAFELGWSNEELSRFINNERGLTMDKFEKLLTHLGLTLSMDARQPEDRDLIRLLSKKLSEEMKA